MEGFLAAVPGPAIRIVDGAIVEANGAAVALFGTDPAAIAGMIHATDREVLLEAATIAAAGSTSTFEIRTSAGPPRRFFSVSIGPHPDGGAVGLVGETTELRRLDETVAELATGVYTTDADLHGLWMPGRLAEGIGIDPALFEGIDVYGLVHPDDVPSARALVARAVASPGVCYAGSLRILHPDHMDAYYAALVHTTWLPDDDALGGLLVRFDTGAVDENADASSEAETGTLTLRDATPLGFLNLSRELDLVQRNPRAREIMRPVTDREDVGDWLDLVRPEDRPVVDELLADALKGDLRPPIEMGFNGKGARVWVRLEILPYRGRSGLVAGIFLNMLDITSEYETRLALAAAREQLWHQARHDALTGLANRVPFVERLAEVLKAGPNEDRRRREPAASRIAVLVCDLDGFKAVNDNHGHDMGDQVLIEVARRLKTSVRAEDTLCRYGGDEFLVLCEAVNPDQIDDLAGRVVAAISDEVIIGGARHRLGMSVGVALAEAGDAEDPDGLVRRADQAMYSAKTQGGRRAVVA